ncbi:hypothetical protein SGPC_00023 [Salmonella phage SGPC]|uniref:hypothetical protein n=1 Tax=Salmonella phage SGPC TaxID=2877945 RepID=UPI00240FBB17|nr:hypothetical protein QA064_gp23 [Salmonella phage SGPC]UCR75449.1 hypothetical protein SGPC_00023 [Salmonella phage SGPC]
MALPNAFAVTLGRCDARFTRPAPRYAESVVSVAFKIIEIYFLNKVFLNLHWQ